MTTQGQGWGHKRGPNDEMEFRRLCPRLETRLEPRYVFFLFLFLYLTNEYL